MDILSFEIERCEQCGLCMKSCVNDVINLSEKEFPIVNNPDNCIECLHCVAICPNNVILHKSIKLNQLEMINHNEINPEMMANFLSSKRSTRNYSPELINEETIKNLIRIASIAPSANNCQERDFIVVSDKWKIAKLKDLVLGEIKKLVRLLKLVTNKIISKVLFLPKTQIEKYKYYIHDFNIALEKAMKGKDSIFHSAPHLIFIYSPKGDPLAKDNCITAQDYLMLQAQSMGLGTCIIGYASNPTVAKKIRKHLGIPKGYMIHSVITLGKPSVQYKRTVLRKSSNIIWE